MLAGLEALSRKYRRSVVFTEIGYRSANGAAWRQWELPLKAPLNLNVQREAYEAFFAAVWPQPWLAGVYPWLWFSSLNHSGPKNNDYQMENKPAADVVNGITCEVQSRDEVYGRFGVGFDAGMQRLFRCSVSRSTPASASSAYRNTTIIGRRCSSPSSP